MSQFLTFERMALALRAELGRNVGLAGKYFGYGDAQLLVRVDLQHVPGSPQAAGFLNIRGGGLNREENELRLQPQCPNFGRRLEPVHLRHADITANEVGMEFLGGLDQYL